MNASVSEDSVAETALAKKNSDGKHSLTRSNRSRRSLESKKYMNFKMQERAVCIPFKFLFLLFSTSFDLVQIIGEIFSPLKNVHNINSLAKPVGRKEFKSTNVQLTAKNYKLTTIANRRWSNMFFLSPRHPGRSNLDIVSNSHTNTSSTDNSNNNLTTASSALNHKATKISRDDDTRTEIAAISAALPAVLFGFTCNSLMRSTLDIHAAASEKRNSVDDNAERVTANIGIRELDNKIFSRFPSAFVLIDSRYHFEVTSSLATFEVSFLFQFSS